MLERDRPAIHSIDRWTSAKGTRRKKTQMTPDRTLAWSGPLRSCIRAMAYPDQPSSSPIADVKIGAIEGLLTESIDEAERCSEQTEHRVGQNKHGRIEKQNPRIPVLASCAYSRTLSPVALALTGPLSLRTRIQAGAPGQAKVSAARGRPGNSCNLRNAPSTENGAARANTSERNSVVTPLPLHRDARWDLII